MTPTIGIIVHYRMSGRDCDAYLSRPRRRFNRPWPGDVCGLQITDVDPALPTKWVSGVLTLNNGDTIWIGSVAQSDSGQRGTWFWPPLAG